MEKFECFLFSLLSGFALIILVHAQDQIGFISIDCRAETSSYTGESGLTYVWYANFIDTGISQNVSSGYQSEFQLRNLWNLRSFPEGIRNCYNVKVRNGTRYLIRASFLYGNYDFQDKVPVFDLHLGANVWDSVILGNASAIITKEIIHAPSSNYIYVCLMNTGSGTPFISALEFRPLKNITYTTEYGSLVRFARLDVRSLTNQTTRGLTGEIPTHLSNLTMIENLDLSNNNLTGPAPEFLSQLKFLRVLNLAGNNLTGSIPNELIEKSRKGSLSLSVEGNPSLCSSVS